jgi:hypothetical protein
MMEAQPGEMVNRKRYDRRTGAAFLCLVAGTNVIPWMELLLGETSTSELLAPSEVRIAVGTSVLALFLLLGTWLSGRYNTIPEKPWIRRPRRAGLQFSIAAAAGNLLLAGIVRFLGSCILYEFPAELALFAAAWYLVVLPLGVLAAFSLGRAGRLPGRRKTPDSL